MSPSLDFIFNTLAPTPLPYFIHRLVANSTLPWQLAETTERIILRVSGPERTLAELADRLGAELPLSVWLTASRVEPTAPDAAPLEPPTPTTSPPRPAADLPPCPRCLATAEANFQAGKADLAAPCGLCRRPAEGGNELWALNAALAAAMADDLSASGASPATAQQNQADLEGNPEACARLCQLAAQRLAAGRTLILPGPAQHRLTAIRHPPDKPPSNGDNRIPPPTNTPDPANAYGPLARQATESDQDLQRNQLSTVAMLAAGLEQNEQILVTDPAALPTFWQCGDDELMLLAALEKPWVRLEPTPGAAADLGLPPRPLPVGLPATLSSWYLARHLRHLRVPMLLLQTPAAAPAAKRPLMLALDGRRWLLSNNFPRPATAGQPLPATTANPPDQQATTAPANPEQHRQAYRGFLKAATNHNQSADAGNGKRRLFGISLLAAPQGLALLTGDQSRPQIVATLPHHRPQTAAAILQAIGRLDEAGGRLCHHYAARFPRQWQALQELTMPWQPDNPAHLWALTLLLASPDSGAALLDASSLNSAPNLPSAGLGDRVAASKGQNTATPQLPLPVAGARLFLRLAATITTGGAPRLETAASQEGPLLDHLLLLRSAMSYTMADAEPAAICRGCLESLAERLATLIWQHCGPADLPQVALCSKLALHPAFLTAIRHQGGTDFLLAPPPVALDTLADWPDWADQADRMDRAATEPLTPEQDRRQALRSLFGLFE